MKRIIILATLIVIVTGGTAGAVALVTSADIQDNTIRSRDVRDGTLRPKDFGGTLLRGPQGAQGAQGPQGAQGDPGVLLRGTLPAGTTLRGTYAAAAQERTSSGGGYGVDSLTFTYPLPVEPEPHIIRAGQTPEAGCGGTVANPAADPGHLCIFEASVFNRDPDEPTAALITRYGAAVAIRAAASSPGGYAYSMGTWAVTGF